VELEPASRWRQATFRNLWQFYMYEFSRFLDWIVPEDGRFAEDDLDGCWTNPKRQPFFIRVDGMPAGFAIIDEREQSKLTGERDVRELTELFVMPAFRRVGVGERAATQLFDRFPGRWELGVLEQNVAALPFWRNVVGRYTVGRFAECDAVMEDRTFRVLSFDSSGRAGAQAR
jgi:predicted acetyltransferase